MAGPIPLNLNPDARTLRSFGWIALVGFGLLAACAWLERFVFAFGLGELRVPVAGVLAALGVLSALLSLVYPRGNRWLFVGLSVATYPIGVVVSYTVLAVLFFVVIAPVGMLLRLLGRDPLARNIDRNAKSYWTPARKQRPKADYFKQF
jgi:hypothetical protein